MNILLTGVTGFLGRRIAVLLKNITKSDDKIILLTSVKVEGYICVEHKNYSYSVEDFLKAGVMHIDIVIHVGWFCAKSNNDIMDIEKNFSPVINTNYLLSHLPNVPNKLIFCSSCNIYGGTGTFDIYKKGEAINEESPICLVDQYAIAKYVTELFIKDWASKHGTVCHILRPGPLYGIGDRRKDYLIGRMLYDAAIGKDLSIYTEPSMKRNYLYVDDCARFIINCIKLKKDVGPINLVSAYNPSIIEIAEMICKVSGNKVHYHVEERDKILGKDLEFSAEKRCKYLGREEITFYQGMKMAYDWNVNHYIMGEE